MKIKICPSCGEKNSLISAHCSSCQSLLKLDTIVEVVEEEFDPSFEKLKVQPNEILLESQRVKLITNGAS